MMANRFKKTKSPTSSEKQTEGCQHADSPNEGKHHDIPKQHILSEPKLTEHHVALNPEWRQRLVLEVDRSSESEVHRGVVELIDSQCLQHTNQGNNAQNRFELMVDEYLKVHQAGIQRRAFDE